MSLFAECKQITCVGRRLVQIPKTEPYDIRPGVVLFHVDGRTGTTKQIAAFVSCFSNALKTVPNRELGYTQ